MNVIQFGLKIYHGQQERNYSLRKIYFGNHIYTPLIVAELLELYTLTPFSYITLFSLMRPITLLLVLPSFL